MQKKLKGRALVADDSASHQLLMLVLMKKIGLEAKVVGNGAAAIEAVDTENFDIIVMELRMPKVDGINAARAIRQKGITVPIIALLTDPYSVDLKECLRVGFNGYLQKPITKKTLYDMMRRHLEGPKARRADENQFDESMLISTIAKGQDVSSVIDNYFEELPEILDGISDTNNNDDIEMIEELVKELKGASNSEGLGLLRKYAEDLEKVLKQTNMDKSHEAADEIYNICLKLIQQQNL
jgi:CheY-like chemotaxis protein/HPt (histidine-containing phosphotransfer) domain-containing protein